MARSAPSGQKERQRGPLAKSGCLFRTNVAWHIASVAGMAKASGAK